MLDRQVEAASFREDATVNQPPSTPKNRHSFRPLLFAPPQGPDMLPKTLPPPPKPRMTRSANDSHVRLRAQPFPLPRAAEIEHVDAQDLLDELCEDQLTMSVDLARLEESLATAPEEASSRSALRTLAARLADLGALRDALATVLVATVDPRLQRIVVPDSALGDYLRGIYAWGHAVVRALDDLAGSLRAQPDWALLRWRIEEAKNFHFDELHEAIRADVLALTIVANGGSFGAERPAIEDLEYAVERLIATAVALEEHLDERFG
jgi:hypothetical protein